MVRHGANCIMAGDPNYTMYCAMAKKFTTDKCFDIVNDALRGYILLPEHELN